MSKSSSKITASPQKTRSYELKCVECFKSLGVDSRMGIYLFLKENPGAKVYDVVEEFNLTQPTISYHLNEMKNLGLLTSEKIGKEVHYRVADICIHHNQECILKEINFEKLKKD